MSVTVLLDKEVHFEFLIILDKTVTRLINAAFKIKVT